MKLSFNHKLYNFFYILNSNDNKSVKIKKNFNLFYQNVVLIDLNSFKQHLLYIKIDFHVLRNKLLI